jgi:hypothetical protein
MQNETELPDEDKPKSWLDKVWMGFFILMYPILMTFSLLFTGLLLVFSTLSKLVSWVVGLLPGQPAVPTKSARKESAASETENAIHPIE